MPGSGGNHRLFSRSIGFFGGWLFPEFQMTGPVQRRQVEVRDKADWVVVQRQVAFDVNRASAVLEVRLTEVSGLAVHGYAKVGSTSGVRELDVYPADFLYALL